jgi:zinc-finger of transposase IS204/IS1001/IS1096/IS1165
MGSDGSAVSALVGLDGFVVVAQVDVDGEWWVKVETIATVVGCESCVSRAVGHGRRLVQVRDLPVAGRPVRLMWAKRLWRCSEPACAVGPPSPGRGALSCVATVEDGGTGFAVPGQRGEARTARPGRAAGTSSPSRTTTTRLTGCAVPYSPSGSSGSAAKSRWAWRYHRMPEIGRFQRSFITVSAGSWSVAPLATASLRWRSCALMTSLASSPWCAKSHGPPSCLHVMVFISVAFVTGSRRTRPVTSVVGPLGDRTAMSADEASSILIGRQ